MLGRFLEIAVSAQPVAAALAFYEGLGFRSVPVGDIVATPYAVVSAPPVWLGLHERERPGPAPTFVRPQLRDHCRALRRLGIDLEFSALRDDEFHSVGFLDPSELLVVLIEARTFSPSEQPSDPSVCGEFLELSVSTHSRQASVDFWSALGCEVVAAGEAPHAWARMAGHGITLGFHERARFEPGLSFTCSNLAARLEYLNAKGYTTRPGAPLSERRNAAATLRGPDGLPLYLLEQAMT
jgi:hypothetical protein